MNATDSRLHKGIESLARLGYVAKGVVYSIVGILAVMSAFGAGVRTTGTKGAINELATQPFGKFILAAMVLGLAGYVVWRFTQGLADPEGKGNDLKGIGARAGLMLSGLIYGGLAVYTSSLLFATGGGSSSTRDHTAEPMSYTGGVWLVAAVGLGFIAVGGYQGWRASSGSFKSYWNNAAMNDSQETWATWVARMGICARALVFVIIGIFLITAAWQSDPSKARGLGGALRSLTSQPFGPWLLALAGAGFLCYGIYCFVNTRFRHINH